MKKGMNIRKLTEKTKLKSRASKGVTLTEKTKLKSRASEGVTDTQRLRTYT